LRAENRLEDAQQWTDWKKYLCSFVCRHWEVIPWT